MHHLNRHDRVLMQRRQRDRALRNRPRHWLWVGQATLAVVLVATVLVATLAGGGIALGLSVCNSYAEQLPDASVIEQQQDDFQTVRIYDRTAPSCSTRAWTRAPFAATAPLSP